MSKLFVDEIVHQSSQGSGTITIGASGETINVVGTLQNNGSAVGGVMTPAFHAGRVGSGQTISNYTQTEVIFDTERFDTNSCYNNSNGRFTPTVAGKYFVYTSLTLASINAVYSEIRLVKNLTTNISFGRHFNDIGYQSSFTHGIIELNGTTDYVSVFTYHEDSVSRDIYNQSQGEASYFGAYKIIE